MKTRLWYYKNIECAKMKQAKKGRFDIDKKNHQPQATEYLRRLGIVVCQARN